MDISEKTSFFSKQIRQKINEIGKEIICFYLIKKISRGKFYLNGEEMRYHLHETILQRAIKEAIAKAAIVKSYG